jgi:hypothetical protein
MANIALSGARYNQTYDTLAVLVAGDVAKQTVAVISSAATRPATVTTAGAGEVPYGVFEETVDYSEDGGRTSVIRNGIVMLTAAAAITDVNVPLKAAASGQVTPVTANNDVIVGKALYTADSGDIIAVDLKLMGSYYGA